MRYLDIHEGDELDEEQLASWIEQAAEIPGWDGSSKSASGWISATARYSTASLATSTIAAAARSIA